MFNLLCILLLIILIVYLFTNSRKENFNDQTGKFCTTCAGKTTNQCLKCFNCGFCVDKWGNSSCIGGDHRGPYNFERCAAWYHTDPYSTMMQRNANYKCNDGPRSSNRLIGI